MTDKATLRTMKTSDLEKLGANLAHAHRLAILGKKEIRWQLERVNTELSLRR